MTASAGASVAAARARQGPSAPAAGKVEEARHANGEGGVSVCGGRAVRAGVQWRGRAAHAQRSTGDGWGRQQGSFVSGGQSLLATGSRLRGRRFRGTWSAGSCSPGAPAACTHERAEDRGRAGRGARGRSAAAQPGAAPRSGRCVSSAGGHSSWAGGRASSYVVRSTLSCGSRERLRQAGDRRRARARGGGAGGWAGGRAARRAVRCSCGSGSSRCGSRPSKGTACSQQDGPIPMHSHSLERLLPLLQRQAVHAAAGGRGEAWGCSGVDCRDGMAASRRQERAQSSPPAPPRQAGRCKAGKTAGQARGLGWQTLVRRSAPPPPSWCTPTGQRQPKCSARPRSRVGAEGLGADGAPPPNTAQHALVRSEPTQALWAHGLGRKTLVRKSAHTASTRSSLARQPSFICRTNRPGGLDARRDPPVLGGAHLGPPRPSLARRPSFTRARLSGGGARHSALRALRSAPGLTRPGAGSHPRSAPGPACACRPRRPRQRRGCPPLRILQ